MVRQILERAREALDSLTGDTAFNAHSAFPAIVTVWFGALFAVGALILPITLFETLFSVTGISAIITGLEAPLGFPFRLVLALALALGGGRLGWKVGNRLHRPEGFASPEQTTARHRTGGKREPIRAKEELGSATIDAPLDAEVQTRRRRRAIGQQPPAPEPDPLDISFADYDEFAVDEPVKIDRVEGRHAASSEDPIDIPAFLETGAPGLDDDDHDFYSPLEFDIEPDPEPTGPAPRDRDADATMPTVANESLDPAAAQVDKPTDRRSMTERQMFIPEHTDDLYDAGASDDAPALQDFDDRDEIPARKRSGSVLRPGFSLPPAHHAMQDHDRFARDVDEGFHEAETDADDKGWADPGHAGATFDGSDEAGHEAEIFELPSAMRARHDDEDALDLTGKDIAHDEPASFEPPTDAQAPKTPFPVTIPTDFDDDDWDDEAGDEPFAEDDMFAPFSADLSSSPSVPHKPAAIPEAFSAPAVETAAPPPHPSAPAGEAAPTVQPAPAMAIPTEFVPPPAEPVMERAPVEQAPQREPAPVASQAAAHVAAKADEPQTEKLESLGMVELLERLGKTLNDAPARHGAHQHVEPQDTDAPASMEPEADARFDGWESDGLPESFEQDSFAQEPFFEAEPLDSDAIDNGYSSFLALRGSARASDPEPESEHEAVADASEEIGRDAFDEGEAAVDSAPDSTNTQERLREALAGLQRLGKAG